MPEIGVSFDALVAGGGRLEDAADSIAGRVSAARSRVEELLGAGWSGGAATAFETEFAAWSSAANDAVEALRGLVTGVRAAAAEFAQTEHAASATSRAIESSLPSLGVAGMMGGGS